MDSGDNEQQFEKGVCVCVFVVVVVIIAFFWGGGGGGGGEGRGLGFLRIKVIILEFTNLCLCFQSIRKLESMIKEAEER